MSATLLLARRVAAVMCYISLPAWTAATPTANDYELVARGLVCQDESRIVLPCGSCGPGWGTLSDCEDVCNSHDNCRFVTFFEDNGCRIYSACNVSSTVQGAVPKSSRVGTEIYQRNDPVP